MGLALTDRQEEDPLHCSHDQGGRRSGRRKQAGQEEGMGARGLHSVPRKGREGPLGLKSSTARAACLPLGRSPAHLLSCLFLLPVLCRRGTCTTTSCLARAGTRSSAWPTPSCTWRCTRCELVWTVRRCDCVTSVVKGFRDAQDSFRAASGQLVNTPGPVNSVGMCQLLTHHTAAFILTCHLLPPSLPASSPKEKP